MAHPKTGLSDDEKSCQLCHGGESEHYPAQMAWSNIPHKLVATLAALAIEGGEEAPLVLGYPHAE